jgi:mannose-1-phosphate guanylyltransferase
LSLLDETLRRVAPISSPDRTVIVVNESQRTFVDEWPGAARYRHVVFQPDDRGTAAGLLFGLVPVLLSDPSAIVLVTPSDHGVESPETFRRGIAEAAADVRDRGGVVLFGVEADCPQTDYGWMVLSDRADRRRVRPVASFIEKPAAETAVRLLAAQGVWNTMVILAEARALLHLCRRRLPVLSRVFVAALTLPRPVRERFLAERYRTLPARDFSRHVLAHAGDLFAFTWPPSIGWSDLGTPERLERWLTRRSFTLKQALHSETAPASALPVLNAGFARNPAT